MESSSKIITMASSGHGSQFNALNNLNAFPNEDFTHQNINHVNEEDPSVSLLSSTIIENGRQYLSLIDQDPVRWTFVSANLNLMAQGKASLEVVLYIIETFLVSFTPGLPFSVEILKEYFNSLGSKDKKLHQELFCKIAKLILETPNLFPNKKRLLLQGQHQSVTLTKTQCLCIIAHMFMCITIPSDPRFTANFGWVFTKTDSAIDIKIEKIKCMFQYFMMAFEEKGEREIVFERVVAEKEGQELTIKREGLLMQAWETCEQEMLQFEYHPKGEMKDEDPNILEVAFSGKSFGGQALRSQITQQEKILFRSPECLVGILLFERARDDEAWLIRGARAFNKCKGYPKAFQWNGVYKEMLTKETIFIDAQNYSITDILQFSVQGINRELNKAFLGFFGGSSLNNETNQKPVSTGKWGCGVYKGNSHLKFLIQWIAASRAGRKMEFYAFADQDEGPLFKDLNTVKKEKDIGSLYIGRQIKDLMVDILKCANEAPQENNKDFNLFAALKNLPTNKNRINPI